MVFMDHKVALLHVSEGFYRLAHSMGSLFLSLLFMGSTEYIAIPDVAELFFREVDAACKRPLFYPYS
jgi:hypothetical protein